LRLKIALRGAVQGVGFRPFVFRLAEELRLAGWVNNSPQGVFIEAEGPRSALEQFLARLESDKPSRSFIQSLESTWLDATGFTDFQIRPSSAAGGKSALVLPDVATCPDCLREVFDPANRRFRYPFTNCTHCGPRFSIIEALPYDRANTSMRSFAMCPRCQAEYDDPRDRRFHAQPNACPVCGPRLELWDAHGENLFGGNEALLAAAQMIRRGKIIAVKSIGGFHLFADARNDAAVALLRQRKHREEKPFALLFPSLASVKDICAVSPPEERLLRSPEAPIVLLRRLGSALRPSPFALSDLVAPGNPNLGVMLPSNPLHHLLMVELGFPVVATSGNLGDEPICTDEHEALERLHGIADAFLVHNRRIVRHLDDSITRVMLGRETILRRARGYAPLPISLPQRPAPSAQRPILAVGAHLKNAVALAVGEDVFLSQHIGDLETEQAGDAFRRVIANFEKLYAVPSEIIAADLHPDYLSTKFARDSGKPVFGVQHHVAHVLSCIAENEVALPALGVAWDGTGYGPDGTVWGGEFFLVTENSVERIAHLRPFPLPGGDAAVKEPRRAALGLLFELFGDDAFARKDLPSVAAFTATELATVKTMLKRKLNSPLTSSIGRLFDAVASLAGLRQRIRFEGQAAMELEFALDEIQTADSYAIQIAPHNTPRAPRPAPRALILDWSPLVTALISDVQIGIAPGIISAKFHHALAEVVVAIAQKTGVPRVVLSGGCFQNRYLTERTVERLRVEQFSPYWHQRVPPNDGGVALGQIVAARRQLHLK
jgi:hydrogenase maturation protein HypF